MSLARELASSVSATAVTSTNAKEWRGTTGTGTATAGVLKLSTAELTVVDADQLGRIDFLAPLEASGTDAILVGASIIAEADNTFAADNNQTELVFATGASEAAAEKMRIASDGKVGIGTSVPVTDLTIEGPITIKEQADADADTAAYGQIWVNTATPNELYFTGDSGVDVQITNATGLAADTVQDTYGNIVGHSTAGDALDTADGGNVALGCNALGAQTDGLNNIAIGCHALAASADDGDLNIAIGKLAMGVGDVSGAENIAIGVATADALTTGACNIAIGHNAYGVAEAGGSNVVIGMAAASACLVTGNCNTAVGRKALCDLTSGACNVAIGVNAAESLTTGSGNIAIGNSAAATGITTGVTNIGIGYLAGRCVTSGSHNIAIGSEAGTSATTQDSTINIGASVNTSTASTTCIGGGCVMATMFSATSDCRSKRNIKDLSYGLNFINLLRPVSYKWKPQADKLDSKGNLIEKGEKNHSHQRTMFGLLGQQVKESLTKLGLNYNDFAGYQDKEEEHGPSGWKPTYTEENKTVSLAYDDFIAPMIKAIQELSAEVTELKAQLKTS